MVNNTNSELSDLLSSGFNDLIGFTIDEWREDYVCLGLVIEDRHRNRSGTVHGGVLAALLDAAGGFAGCFCTVDGNVRKAMTLSLATNFTGQARDGRIHVIATRKAGGRKIFFIQADVFDSEENLLATAQGTYRYRSGSESPEGLPVTDA